MSEHNIDNDGVSNPNTPESDPIISEITNASDGPSLDAIFGDPSDGDTPDNGTPNKPAGGPSIPSPGTPKATPEEYLRELQSKADKASHQVERLKQENTELTSVADFVNQLYEDPQVFEAFVAEINPELVKPKNPEDYITSNLKKEFGEDFVPDLSDENIRGSRTWLYNKRADALYEESLSQQNKVPETISSLKKKRADQRKEIEQKAKLEKQEILTDLKWTDQEYQGFLKWANKVSTKDFAHIYNYGKNKRNSGNKSPNLAGMPSGSPVSASAYDAELNEFFG